MQKYIMELQKTRLDCPIGVSQKRHTCHNWVTKYFSYLVTIKWHSDLVT